MPRQFIIHKNCLASSPLVFMLVVLPCAVATADQLIILRSGNLAAKPAPDTGESCASPLDCPPLDQFLIDACQVPTCEKGICGFESACSENEICDGNANCTQVIFPCTTFEDCEPLDQLLIDSCWVRTCESGFCGSRQACSELEQCDGAGNCDQVVFPCETASDCPPLEQSLIDRCHEPTCENLLCDSADVCSEVEACDGAASCVQIVFFDGRLPDH